MTEAQKDTLCGKGTLAYPQSYNPIELEALALEFALEDCQDLPKEAIKKLGKGMFKFVIKEKSEKILLTKVSLTGSSRVLPDCSFFTS